MRGVGWSYFAYPPLLPRAQLSQIRILPFDFRKPLKKSRIGLRVEFLARLLIAFQR